MNNDGKKILWVTNAFGVGGAERQMLYMYHILEEFSDYSLTVLYYAKVGTELPLDGVNTVYIDKKETGRISTILKIRKYIKDNNIDIMHAFGGCSANIYGRAGTILTKAIPVGAMLGKKHFASIGNKLVNSFLNLFGNWWTVNNKELIPILKRDLTHISNDKIRMLHNGFVPADRIDYKPNEMTEYDQKKGDRFVFCAVGRLQPVKNYTLFIEAAERVLNKYPNVQFWIIGGGEEYNKLEGLIEQKNISKDVILWGYRSDIDIALSRCDAFVQTSITEGSPNTIAEAMRARKPIISTRSTDLSEMIEIGKNGEIVDSDINDLYQAMEKVICLPPEKRKEMGEHSYQLFEQNFLDQTVAKEFIEFYDELLTGRK